MKIRAFKTLFFILGSIVILIGSYFIFFSKQEEVFGESIFIIEDGEVWQLDFDWDGRNIGKQLTNDGFKKSLLEVAPAQRKFGYFRHLYSRPIYQDKDSYYENYLALIIYNLITKNEKEIYRGDYHTSYWEWLDDSEVVVYHNCGSECMIGFVINTDTGIEKAKLLYGVGYEWSPNKELVVAYHYSGGYGITVGDKYSNVLFEFRRSLPLVYSKLANETKATWSEDGKTISLVIKKENEEKLEIIKFDVDNDFKIISQ